MRWNRSLPLAIALMAAALSARAQAPEAPWNRLYAGDDATGPAVIALWQFQAGKETADASGHGHTLSLRGAAQFADNGPLGTRCLESFATDEKAEKPCGATAKHHPALNPEAAFTLELWINPKPEFAERKTAMLLDKKYYHYNKELPAANTGYCLFLQKAGEAWKLQAHLGYGKDSALFSSDAIRLEPGAWRHIAFTYNGAGLGRFWLDGQAVGRTLHENRGAITPSTYALVIGDRVGSSYIGFPGFIGQVRISSNIPAMFAGSAGLEPAAGRRVFERMEPGATLRVTVSNDTLLPLADTRVQAVIAGRPAPETILGEVSVGATKDADLALDTSLRPGDYAVTVRLTGRSGAAEVASALEFPITIAARLPPCFPVLNWGADSQPARGRALGFTHQIAIHADYARIWNAGQPTDPQAPAAVQANLQKLDDYLRAGLRAVGYFHEQSHIHNTPDLIARFGRIDRQGKPLARPNVCGLLPAVREFSYNVGVSVARAYGAHPAFAATLVHSEQRDSTELCFHEEDRVAYRKATGLEIPDAVRSKGGINYSNIKDFPADRVIADNDPLLTYYRWFWREGDGWNGLHTALHEGLKTGVRPGFWTFYDPAVRVPSVWGSGGKVDVISHWTYTYPDPLKMGYATDELFAMADGAPGQKVMKMTQAIWYRSQTAPTLPENEADRAPWEKEQPDAKFISIAPDFLRIGLWSEIARPVAGVMYHGYASLVPWEKHGSYCFTDGRAKDALQALCRDVLEPYGPMLLDVPDRPADVALLESFASQMFAGRGTWGWSNGWEADVHLILQWAQVQPRVIYEEKILRDGLDGFKVLVMPSCDVLPRGVVERIQAWHRRGGILIGDANLCPALTPDIVLRPYRRTKKAAEDKAALQAIAAEFRKEFDALYVRPAESRNPDVVVRLRKAGSADYLFAINDTRAFDNYVGHHGLVMEEGMAAKAGLVLRRKNAVVYELPARKRVAVTPTADGVRWDADFGPGEGKLYLALDRAVGGVKIAAPASVKPGAQAEVVVTVHDDRGAPLDAVAPVRIAVTDAEGKPVEFSGAYAAPKGVARVVFDVARNEPAGPWTLRATDLLSGAQSERTLTVAP